MQQVEKWGCFRHQMWNYQTSGASLITTSCYEYPRFLNVLHTTFSATSCENWTFEMQNITTVRTKNCMNDQVDCIYVRFKNWFTAIIYLNSRMVRGVARQLLGFGAGKGFLFTNYYSKGVTKSKSISSLVMKSIYGNSLSHQ